MIEYTSFTISVYLYKLRFDTQQQFTALCGATESS